MLLSDEEISDLWVTELDDRKTVTTFARAIEAAILAKLASAELPEPVVFDGSYLKNGEWEFEDGYTADQLRQAYAQGAAAQLDRLEKAEKDAARLDWLEASTDMHGFCHSEYGDFRYYAHQQDGCKTVRQVIDEAMEASK